MVDTKSNSTHICRYDQTWREKFSQPTELTYTESSSYSYQKHRKVTIIFFLLLLLYSNSYLIENDKNIEFDTTLLKIFKYKIDAYKDYKSLLFCLSLFDKGCYFIKQLFNFTFPFCYFSTNHQNQQKPQRNLCIKNRLKNQKKNIVDSAQN